MHPAHVVAVHVPTYALAAYLHGGRTWRRAPHFLLPNEWKNKMPEVTTLCFHSDDAAVHSDGSFTFDVPALPTAAATKVALASFEFPMVQYTVEHDMWDRLWFAEGDAFTGELHVAVRLPGEPDPELPVVVPLPRRLNRVVATRRQGDRLVCTTEHPHGVLPGDDRALLLGDAKGDAHVTDVLSETEVATADDRDAAFALACDPRTVASPAALCERLTALAARTLDEYGVVLTFRYDPRADRILLHGRVEVAGTVVRLLPNTTLVHRLGLSTMHMRFPDAVRTLVWPSGVVAGIWRHVQLPAGYYAPSTRPLGTGPPLRLGAELERALGRWYFPLLDDGQHHQLVYANARGNVRTVEVPCGRYDAETLRRVLDVGTDDRIHVRRTEDDRFLFESDAPFDLLFHHPGCLDATRLGFLPGAPLSGERSYVAPTRTPDGAHTLVRVGEVPAQRRFTITPVPPPLAVGIGEGSCGDGVVALRTSVQGRPFAHGLRPGDLVVLVEPADGTSPAKVAIDGETRRTCAVATADDDPCVLRVRTGGLHGIGDRGSRVLVEMGVEPLNLCFCRPRSLPPSLLGFGKCAVQWGVDGSVTNSKGELCPPFVAPGVHNLEHPDSVLLSFTETNAGTLVTTSGGDTRHAFVKLPLYPSLREERLLPRDAHLSTGKPTTLTLTVLNPDGRTPYQFHHAQFSFSLALVAP